MNSRFSGKAVVVGDNIDTDVICPGRYLELTDPAEIGRHCLAGLDEGFAQSFPQGGVLVAGKNFGCGSSREHAAIALLNMGARAVLAESFARIFYRNGINLGLPLVVCSGVSAAVQSGQSLTVDMTSGTVSVAETGAVLAAEPLSGQALAILEAGGIKPLMRSKHGTGPAGGT